MFRRKILVCLILLTVKLHTAFAQQKTLSNPWSFQSILNFGLLEGETGSSFQLQAINGAQYKSWFAGIGLGLDYYRLRTIPLFLDIRKEFGKNRDKLFVYADGGVSFTWATDAQKTDYYMPNPQYHNGFYSDFGFGYKAAVGKRSALLVSVGYSYKKASVTYALPNYYYQYNPNIAFQNYPSLMMQNGTGDKISYSLNRLSMKIGWEF
jgi:hypothetical protein